MTEPQTVWVLTWRFDRTIVGVYATAEAAQHRLNQADKLQQEHLYITPHEVQT